MSNEYEKSEQNEVTNVKHSAVCRRSCLPRTGDNVQTNNVTNIPETKCIQIYINGDEHFSGCRCVINSRYYRNLDMFLNYLTERLQPSFGAVRNIYTPVNGHAIAKLEDFISKHKYVVAGNERFKKLDFGYADIGDKRNRRARFNPKNKFKVSKPKTLNNSALTLYLFQNGNHKMKPCKLNLLPQDLETLDFVYRKIYETLKWGPVKRLCLLNGKPVKSIDELVNNHSYVTVRKHEVFKVGSYGCFKNNSGREKYFIHQPSQKSSVIATRSSEVHSLSSAQSLKLTHPLSSCRSNRKTPLSQSAAKREPRKVINQTEFVDGYQYFNAYENVMLKNISAKEDFVNKINLDLDADLGGIFRSKMQNNQTIGAAEIEDGPETIIDLPLDLLDAEEIEDEITPDMERSLQHLSLDVTEEIVAFLPAISKKNSERQLSANKYDISHSQTLDSHNVFV